MSDYKMVIVVRKDLNMRKGKIAAQCAHAAMKFLVDSYHVGDEHLAADLTPAQIGWLTGQFAKIVVSVDSEHALLALIEAAKAAGVDCRPITDAGRTEFHGVPTLTCAAFGPDEPDKLNPITGLLPLL